MRLERRDWCVLLLLAAATVAVYAPALPGTFVYDDHPLLLENPLVTESFPVSAFVEQTNGRPLTLFSFFANYQLGGPSPGAFRAVNLGLHLLAVGLLFAVLLPLGRPLAFAAAFLFALHPLQSQPVNYVWSRSMLLMAVFALAAVLWRDRPVVALIFVQLAVWSRAEALVLLVPLLLLNRQLVRPGLLLGLANGVALAAMLLRLPAERLAWAGFDPVAHWLAAPAAAGKYFLMFANPQGFAIDHGSPVFDWTSLAGVAALSVAALLIVSQWRRRPLVAAGLAWALLWLAPGLAIPNGDSFNESRSYLALAGLALAAGAVFQEFDRRSRPGAVAALAIVVAVLAPLTAARSGLWTDETALWREAVERNPANGHAHYNLGAALTAEPDGLAAAERAFETAWTLDPGDDRAAAGLGYCRQQRADREGARWYYQEALSLNAQNRFARESLERLTRD